MSGGPIINVDDVIEDCVRQRRGGTVKSQVYLTTQKQLFLTCWEALNRWVLFRMEKRQGVDIPNFAQLAWEYFKSTDGSETRCRPIFIPSESFCQAFKVKYKPPHSLPCLGPLEELNYSKVSIKFSKNLTKDLLFVGLRDIIRRIGELTAAKQSELRIAFSVGYLVANDRRLHFEFDAAILTTPDATALFDKPPITLHRDPVTGRSLSSARSALSSARSQRSARVGTAPTRSRVVLAAAPMTILKEEVRQEERREEEKAGGLAPAGEERGEQGAGESQAVDEVVVATHGKELPVAVEEEEGPVVPEDKGEDEGVEQGQVEEEEEVTGSGRRRAPALPKMARLPLERISARPHTTGSHRFPSRLLMSTKDPATAEVLKQGYQRYMYALKELAEEDKEMRTVIDCQGHAMEEKEKSKKIEAAKQRKDVQTYILSQIERREKEKHEALEEKKQFSSTTIPLKTDPRMAGVVLSKKELVQTLEQQIKYKEDRTAQEKSRRLQEEQRFLEYINEELKLQARERCRKKQETRTMLKATWDMEAEFSRCKELLKKRGGRAVLDHLDRTGLERTILTPSSVNRLAQSAVGYDSRR